MWRAYFRQIALAAAYRIVWRQLYIRLSSAPPLSCPNLASSPTSLYTYTYITSTSTTTISVGQVTQTVERRPPFLELSHPLIRFTHPASHLTGLV